MPEEVAAVMHGEPRLRTPNLALTYLREMRGWTQQEFADRVTAAAIARGDRQTLCDVRMVRRWENGEVLWPQDRYRVLIEAVFSRPITDLGFARRWTRDAQGWKLTSAASASTVTMFDVDHDDSLDSAFGISAGPSVSVSHDEVWLGARTAQTERMLDQARRESEQLLTAPDSVDLDQLQQGIADLAVNARFEPYPQTVAYAMEIRAELLRRLRQGAHRPHEIPDLLVALGRVCGVLAYVTLDLGQADTAGVHARAAFAMGDRADSNTLRAWSRGTQSLVYRFEKNFEPARDAAADGLRYADAPTGTARARLLCGLGQSTSNLGDTATAITILEDADRARETAGEDELGGLFTFTRAKQVYYSGSALMWAEDPAALRRSVAASEAAIDAWQDQRSPGDEMLSQVYLATANAKLGDLDASIAALRPVLDQPITAHFSWVRKRLTQLAALLDERYPKSATAGELREELCAYVHATSATQL
jgi:transcriptional regulator with XRE-family HTH domain